MRRPKAKCLAPFAPNDTKVRATGTYYAFQPNNGDAVHEYAAELAVRYFKEQTRDGRARQAARAPRSSADRRERAGLEGAWSTSSSAATTLVPALSVSRAALQRTACARAHRALGARVSRAKCRDSLSRTHERRAHRVHHCARARMRVDATGDDCATRAGVIDPRCQPIGTLMTQTESRNCRYKWPRATLRSDHCDGRLDDERRGRRAPLAHVRPRHPRRRRQRHQPDRDRGRARAARPQARARAVRRRGARAPARARLRADHPRRRDAGHGRLRDRAPRSLARSQPRDADHLHHRPVVAGRRDPQGLRARRVRLPDEADPRRGAAREGDRVHRAAAAHARAARQGRASCATSKRARTSAS